ncbi:uncharacterized protein BDR25DRAFT_341083 [Lindgomyces ingoldianus]|uniref:Uncharacterized protein n=1 Tax=Lindgomyces ingoldianus TaxID=673940 RepID=A0ACB6R3G0_9PLEO|nr:uncharacterized protein BDR25DRAFT_341083 [Lindgomyces ingoldianus]KAF2473823.1 hypothetical protein BDR25DRAFT_341083 [Lindgomyces ingoldianus]
MVRVKHRYLLVSFLYPQPPTNLKPKDGLPELLQLHQPTPDGFYPGTLRKAIQNGVTELFGDCGVGMVSTGLKVSYLSNATSTAIVKCPRAHYQMVWAALTFMTKLPGPVDTPVVVKVVRVSGTIKKLEEEVIRRAKKIIERAKMVEGSIEVGGSTVDIVKAVKRRTEDQVLVEIDEESSDGGSE